MAADLVSPGMTWVARGRLLCALEGRRLERLLENIQGFVQVGTRMLRGHAGAKTNLVLRHCRIINRGNPEPASPEFMSHPIHAFAIPDDDRHHVGRRSARIQAELPQLLMEIIRVLPEPGAQLRFANADLERFQNRRDHDRWQGTRVNVWVRVKPEILKSFSRPRDKTA